jgi:hypothetical protein
MLTAVVMKMNLIVIIPSMDETVARLNNDPVGRRFISLLAALAMGKLKPMIVE